jgi:predicted RNA polymerase sigma factor
VNSEPALEGLLRDLAPQVLGALVRRHAHLLEQAGDPPAAREFYLRAARMTSSLPEQRYVTRRAALLRTLPPTTDPTGS